FVVLPSTTANQPPLASASATPTSGTVPLTVAFSGAGSSDPDGTIVSYSWTFGDGGSGSGISVSHTYSTAGTFTATLTVTDNGSASASASQAIQATADPNAINPPTNLSGTGNKGSVKLQWTDNSGNEQGFYIERAVSASNPAFTRVASVGPNVTQFSELI